ncbi:MAG TPA: hypothetical protein VGC42_27675 [Kofleriaceae bacterium]
MLVDAELLATGRYQALAGPALVRLSGATAGQHARSDILGLALRLQRRASRDPREGDQDLLFGTFESFFTLGRAVQHTRADDYLANRYASVAPWWIPGLGAAVLRLEPIRDAGAFPDEDRLARLDTAIGRDAARFALTAGDQRLGELVLRARRAGDPRFRASLFRQGRGLRPLGFRNGIRATVYPINQTARRLRKRDRRWVV